MTEPDSSPEPDDQERTWQPQELQLAVLQCGRTNASPMQKCQSPVPSSALRDTTQLYLQADA